MRVATPFFLLLLAANFARASTPAGDVDHQLDAQVCAAAAQTILAASQDATAIFLLPGGDPVRERCVAATLARYGRVLAAYDSPRVLQVTLRGDEVQNVRFSTRLSLSSFDAAGSAWTHVGRLEFSGDGAGHWRFSRFVIRRFIGGRRVRRPSQ